MVSAISDRLSRLKPSRYITANVPMSDSGTERLGMMVAGHVAQEEEDHHHDESDSESQLELHIIDRGTDGVGPIRHDVMFDVGRQSRRAGSAAAA